MTRTLLITAVLGTALTGCTETLNANATQVQPFTNDPSPSCKYLGLVHDVHRFGLTDDEDMASVNVLIRNKVAALGGNRYRVQTQRTNDGATWMAADAYRCP